MAFLGLYAWHSILTYVIARRLSGFRWTVTNFRLGLVFLPGAGLLYGAFLVLPLWQATAIGAAVALASGIYALRVLLRLLPA